MTQRPPELDPDVLKLFIDEAEQKAREITRGIAEWNEQPDSLDRMVWLQMRFAEYRGIANTLGLQRSGQNCGQAVDELTQVIGGARAAEDSLPALFNHALESIDYALEFLHGDDVDPRLVYDAPADEPTVAEQLPELTFPDIRGALTLNKRVQPGAATETRIQPPPANVDPELLDVFMDEALELLEIGDTAWQNWNDGKQTQHAIKEIRRVFHTLKGGARLTQLTVLGDYLHAAEDDMGEAEAPHRTQTLKSRCRFTLDQLQAAFIELNAGRAATLILKHHQKPLSPLQRSLSKTKNTPTAFTESQSAKANPPPAKSFVRISTQLLEALRLRTGEVSARRNQIQQASAALQTEQKLTQLTLSEANNTLRQTRFALERLISKLPNKHNTALTDAQLESQIALQTLEDVLLRLDRQTDRGLDLSSHVERALNGQSRATFSLQDSILNTRLVPFSDFESRLDRIVRQTADSCNKRAALRIHGFKVDVDRGLLDQLLPALEHILRNAVVHGIEHESIRREKGKPAVGNIEITVRKTRGKLELNISDDGAGLATEVIREKAITMGVISQQEALSTRRLERLIFHPGLSATDQLDQLSGRGVGLDVVEHSVHGLGGNIDVTSTAGERTAFTLRLPMGESALNAIIINIADELYAVPQQDICSIQRLDGQTLSRGYQEDIPLAWHKSSWNIRSLEQWLGLDEGRLPGAKDNLPALLIEADQGNFAIVVDHCSGSAEYTLETLPAAVTGILGVSGAVLLEDGQIAPLLDLPALCDAKVRYQRPKLALAPPDPNQRFKVMLVDDSSTWLRQLQRGLSRYPFDLTTCKDGQEALNMLETAKPQLLIVDLEMPRMDGLEFLRRLRRNGQHSNVPAIMFSTVTGTTQRNRARQLGAKAWVSKNANLHPLMVEIDRHLGTEFARHEADFSATS